MGSPRNVRAPFGLGQWLRRLRGKGDPTPYERGIALLDAGRAEDAVTAFSQALSTCGQAPSEPSGALAATYNKRGVAYVTLGRRDEALADFRAALDCDRNFASAHVNLGNLSLEAGRIGEAIEHYEAALRVDDKSVAAHRHLGIAYKRLGRHADAVRHFRTAVRLEIKLPWQRR